MEVENEDALDHLIICPKCYTLHKEIEIKDGFKACCCECGTLLYCYNSRAVEHGLALSITALIFFAVANFFPIVKIEILGVEQFITISQTFITLFDNGFYFVGLLCAFLIFVSPLVVVSLYIILFTLFKMKQGARLSKLLLVWLSYSLPWNMSDIFLISILVALVKLIGYAQIHMGIAFWALMVFVVIDLYITKMIHISELWILRRRIFMDACR